MAREVADEEIALKLRARRRLIGAVALTTALAVILPMVMDNEPRQSAQDIDLRIPDKEKTGEFVPQVQHATAVPAPVAAESAAVVAQPTAIAPPEVVVPVVVPEKTLAKQEAPPVKLESPLKSEVKSKSDVPAKPESKPESKPRAETKAESKVDPKPSIKPNEPAKEKSAAKAEAAGGFILQVGAYANAAVANDWQKKLTKQGYKAYTESSNGKERLRVGPFPTREAAENVRHKLEAQGMHPDLLEKN